MKRLIMTVVLILAAASASAQDGANWLAQHARLASGVTIADGTSREWVGVRIVAEEQVAPKWIFGGRLDLFTRQRDADPSLPTTADALSTIYSDGEAWLSLRHDINPKIGIECVAGLTFGMRGVTADDPSLINPTKTAFACGPRLTSGRATVLIAGGHYGAVHDGGAVALGFVPSMLVTGRLSLTSTMTFVPDLFVGRRSVDDRAVYSLRLSVEKGF